VNYFLDYDKTPADISWLPRKDEPWEVVKTFAHFIEKAMIVPPTFISFGEMQNAESLSCVGWYIDFCERKNLKFPLYAIHTPVSTLRRNIESAIVRAGKDNIIRFEVVDGEEEKIEPEAPAEKPIVTPQTVDDERIAIMKQRSKALANQREQDERRANWQRSQEKQLSQKRQSARGVTEETTVEISDEPRRRGRPPAVLDVCWSTVQFLEDADSGALSRRSGPFYAINLQGESLGEVIVGKKITLPAGTFYIAREP